jgi:putative transposase
MTRIKLLDGAWIDYRGQRWHLERRHLDKIEWRCRETLTHQIFTDAELQKQIRLGKVSLFNGVGREPKTGRSSRVHGKRGASDIDLEEAKRKLIYVLALRSHGLPAEGRPESDWQQVIDQVYEEQGRHWKRLRSRTDEVVSKPSVKSARRWVGDAGDPPKLEKLISNHRFKGNYDDKIDPELRKLIGTFVDEHYLRRPPITLVDLKVRIAGAMPDFNAGRAERGLSRLPAPGEKAIQSSIDAVPKHTVVRLRYGEMAAFLRYGSAEAQEDPEKPLDRVELDATRMDLFVVDPESHLPIGRPWLVVVLDRCTRMVLGWFVTFEPPSILALMQALRNAMLSKDYVQELKEERGWIIDNDPETFGVPRVLVVDRARENIAEHVARFAVRAGVNRVEIMAGKKPWLKGAVERVIKTISEKLLHPTKGTTFHNTLKRLGYNSQKDAVCTPDDLDYALHKFFIDIYPFEPRRGLNGRQAIKVWREKTEDCPVDSVGTIDEVAHLFGRTDRAVPGRYGINAHSMQYFSRELLDVQTSDQFQKALAKQGGKLEYHLDPAQIDMIHVRMPHVNEIIHVPVAPKWREYARGLSLWHHRRIREFIRADASTDAATLLKARLDLIEIMRGSAASRKTGQRARSMTARMEGLQRLAPAGTDARNTVPGSDAHTKKVGKSKSKRPTASNDDAQPTATKPHIRLVVDQEVAAEGQAPEAQPVKVRRPRKGWTE